MILSPIDRLPEEIDTLAQLAQSEGYRHVTRLISDWQSGQNRFDQPGECLFVAYDGVLVGVCGLNRTDQTRARLRRMYVHPEFRNRGIGHGLLANCLAHAKGSGFEFVELFTESESAARFYERAGFRLVTVKDHCSHEIQLT